MDTTEQTNEIVEEKPKRVLTEAQRLAFMKGREKRMANIERKRQEKLEAEEETQYENPAKIEPLEPVKKKEVTVKKEVLSPPPSPPKLVRQHADIHPDFAKTVVDMLYSRLVDEPPSPPERPKRAYTKRKVSHAPPPTTRELSPSYPDIPPQKSFNWM